MNVGKNNCNLLDFHVKKVKKKKLGGGGGVFHREIKNKIETDCLRAGE